MSNVLRLRLFSIELKNCTWHFLTFTWNRAGVLVYLVERAKKCLDFCATLYIIHLFICTIYGGWPASITWWVVNITSLVLMALLGEYLCMRRELQEIPISSRFRSSKSFSVLINCIETQVNILLKFFTLFIVILHLKHHWLSVQLMILCRPLNFFDVYSS